MLHRIAPASGTFGYRRRPVPLPTVFRRPINGRASIAPDARVRYDKFAVVERPSDLPDGEHACGRRS